MLCDSYVMKVQGIPRAGMKTIEHNILNLAGVRFVVPTPKTESHGEWRILIKSSKFHGVNSHIRQHWESWCRTIPEESFVGIKESFPIPAITSKNLKTLRQNDDTSEESYGTLLSTASTLTADTLEGNGTFDYCPLNASMPTYAQVLHSNTPLQSPTSTITHSVHRPQAVNTTKPGSESEDHSKWEEENRQLHQRLREQEARLHALDIAKSELDKRLEKVLEEVQNKECRTKELEETIANLLTVVSDRDQQMAERDQQFELRNRQFDTLMARLEVQHNILQNSAGIDEHSQRMANGTSRALIRSNKRQHTLQTQACDNTLVTEYYDSDMHDTTEEARPIQKC